MKPQNPCLAAAQAAFPLQGEVVKLKTFGSGHINDTYAVYLQGPGQPYIGYVLQRLNTHVFKKPREVMENIVGVTKYLHRAVQQQGGNPARSTLHFLKTHEGQPAFYDAEGMPWRCYRFIENSFCYEQSPTPEVFYESARAFGNFLYQLRGYPAATLHETIPFFHDTPKRLAALEAAAQTDARGRLASCRQEVAFAAARKEACHLLTGLQQQGLLPLRVTHNDTKLNNVLFDTQTKKALCVIDLDTIMPGLAANDFGDSIRFGATTAAEDEPELTKVHFSLPLFEAYTKGYLETAGPALTPTEIDTLPLAARLLTLECGMRFLTDYLEGDTYFKTSHPTHNLERCRTQFKLVQDMEAEMGKMDAIVKKHARHLQK